MIVHQQHNSLGTHNYNAFFYDNCEWFYHFHKNYELAYVLGGEVELTLNANKYILPADSFALIFPNEFHAYHTPEHSRVWIGVFSADFVGEFSKRDTPMRIRTSCRPPLSLRGRKPVAISWWNVAKTSVPKASTAPSCPPHKCVEQGFLHIFGAFVVGSVYQEIPTLRSQ